MAAGFGAGGAFAAGAAFAGGVAAAFTFAAGAAAAFAGGFALAFTGAAGAAFFAATFLAAVLVAAFDTAFAFATGFFPALGRADFTIPLILSRLRTKPDPPASDGGTGPDPRDDRPKRGAPSQILRRCLGYSVTCNTSGTESHALQA